MGPDLLLSDAGADAAPSRGAEGKLERLLDVGLGLTALGWSVAGLVLDGDLPLVARASISAVNVVVGVSFMVRSVAARAPGLYDVAAALPSIALSGVAYRYAAREWSTPALGAFVLAALFTVASLATLGRSFSIFPAKRALVVRGPYGLVRHPIYLGELAMIVIAAATGDALAALSCFGGMLVLLVPRIVREEKQLETDAAHASYRARVRYRLIPFVY